MNILVSPFANAWMHAPTLGPTSGSSSSTPSPTLPPLFINLSFYLVITSGYEQHQLSRGISPLLSIVNSSNSNFNNNFNTFNKSYTTGITDTLGFVRYHAIYWSVLVCTQHGYGVCGYGYSVEKPDPWYTCVQPYAYLLTITIVIYLVHSLFLIIDHCPSGTYNYLLTHIFCVLTMKSLLYSFIWSTGYEPHLTHLKPDAHCFKIIKASL